MSTKLLNKVIDIITTIASDVKELHKKIDNKRQPKTEFNPKHYKAVPSSQYLDFGDGTYGKTVKIEKVKFTAKEKSQSIKHLADGENKINLLDFINIEDGFEPEAKLWHVQSSTKFRIDGHYLIFTSADESLSFTITHPELIVSTSGVGIDIPDTIHLSSKKSADFSLDKLVQSIRLRPALGGGAYIDADFDALSHDAFSDEVVKIHLNKPARTGLIQSPDGGLIGMGMANQNTLRISTTLLTSRSNKTNKGDGRVDLIQLSNSVSDIVSIEIEKNGQKSTKTF